MSASTSEKTKKNTNKFWKAFQNFLGNTIPEFIVTILTSAGYDSALSIADLNESDILIIQDHVSNKARHLVKEYAPYTENEKFEFLPGHRKLVLGLRNKVKDFNTRINKKPSKKLNQAPVNIQGEKDTEEIQLLNAEEIAKLRHSLIVKLSNIYKSIGSASIVEEQSIGTIDAYISKNLKAIASQTASYKCSVKCVECKKELSCTFNKRWETSNFLQHLKSHKNNVQKEIDELLDN